MGHQCCSKQKVKRGLWSPEEDDKLVKYITTHGHGCWSAVPKLAGLQRCGKSCRLRWINYLRPDLKRGSFTEEEERIIIDVHRILGNRWAQIAKHLPGRTDNEVKNFWNSCIKKKLVAQGLDPKTHNLMRTSKSGSYNNNLITNSASSQYPSGTTPFTISSPGKNNADPMKSGALLDINPALLAVPPRTLHINEPNMPVGGNYPYQENGVLMSFKDHQNPNSSSFDFTNAASCSSSSLDHATNIPSSSPFNHAAGGFLDDQSVMWAPNGIDTMDMSSTQPNELAVAATIHASAVGHDQPQNVNYHDVNEKGMELDASYAGNAFDMELMDSALMPCGMLYGGGGGNSTMEQLQWDC